VSGRPRVLEFDVTVDPSGDARSGLGGTPVPRQEEWWAEHLVLAGLVRCTLASMGHAARRAGLEWTSSGSAHGVVTKREEDGLYAFVDIETRFEVTLEPRPAEDDVRNLVAKAEHGCFVSHSLRATPRHRWIVNGEEVM
jgi:organic hydroperoxide reductase OsmC/OhrA